jgi:hypothetical protein
MTSAVTTQGIIPVWETTALPSTEAPSRATGGEQEALSAMNPFVNY